LLIVTNALLFVGEVDRVTCVGVLTVTDETFLTSLVQLLCLHYTHLMLIRDTLNPIFMEQRPPWEVAQLVGKLSLLWSSEVHCRFHKGPHSQYIKTCAHFSPLSVFEPTTNRIIV